MWDLFQMPFAYALDLFHEQLYYAEYFFTRLILAYHIVCAV